MALKHLLKPTAFVFYTIFAQAAFASGSDAGGSAETGDAQLYNAGKAVYARQLACSTCVLAGKSLDASLAKEILSGKNVPSLSADDAQALSVYLKRRFAL